MASEARSPRLRAPTITVDTDDDAPAAAIGSGRLHSPATGDSYLNPVPGRGRSSSWASVTTAGGHPDRPAAHIYLDVPSAAPGTGSVDYMSQGGSSVTTSAAVFSVAASQASSTFTLPGSESEEDMARLERGPDAVHCTAAEPFRIPTKALSEMVRSKSIIELAALGGLGELAQSLRTDVTAGLSLDEAWSPVGGDSNLLRARKAFYGANSIPERKIKGILELMLLAFGDKVLVLLSVVAVVSLVLGLYQAFCQPHAPGEARIEWVDGVTIVAAVVIVVVTEALNSYQKERQFARLNKKKEDRLIRAIRTGRALEIPIRDILVGDVLHLEPGTLVPVDGVLISGYNLRCDESSMTGESNPVSKITSGEALAKLTAGINTDSLDPFIISGSKVLEGIGTYLVTGVGVNSAFGALKMATTERTEPTPLQQKLSVVADKIAMAGVSAAVVLFLVLLTKFLVRLPFDHPSPLDSTQAILRIFILSITVVVMAVPEGLPLAVTLALAIAVTRMLRDNNLVRVFAACETMGNATTVCCDKTGTLTLNTMKITAGTVGLSSDFSDHGEGSATDVTRSVNTDGASPDGAAAATARICSTLSPGLRDVLVKSIAINSTTFEGMEDGKPTYIGSKTEAALLTFAKKHLGMGTLQGERMKTEVVTMYPFDSTRKCMAVVTRSPAGPLRMYLKGAPELILDKCTRVIPEARSELDDAVELTTERSNCLRRAIDAYASQALRTMGLAYKDLRALPSQNSFDAGVPLEDVLTDMTFIAVLGMQDPLRPGIATAVALCQRAGVYVRMVTGDNVRTSMAIASECGILTASGLVMEGSEFRKLPKASIATVLPRLQVLARSSPEDKRLLVKGLKELGEIVAVTGDGTNDGPALQAADVGFSMGIEGTDVAREASSIVLMDDNFASIVKAIKWGRSVNDAVKKFLPFQLTVNITAVTLTFASAVASNKEEPALTPVQLLWLNLIMDTLAALALATEPANEDVLQRLPEGRTTPLISATGWKMMLGQAVYQLAVMLILDTVGLKLLGYAGHEGKRRHRSLVFNTFVWMQFFNLLNSRRLDNQLNTFRGITQNPYFLAVSVVIITVQVLFISFGGEALSVAPLLAREWAISLVLGGMSIPVGILIRLIPDELVRRFLSGLGLASKTAEVPVTEAPLGSPWLQAVEGVRHRLAFRRQVRSSRRSQFEIATPIRAIIFGQGRVGDEEENERSPLIRRSPEQSSASLPPAAVLVGLVAGSIGGWPVAPPPTTAP